MWGDAEKEEKAWHFLGEEGEVFSSAYERAADDIAVCCPLQRWQHPLGQGLVIDRRVILLDNRDLGLGARTLGDASNSAAHPLVHASADLVVVGADRAG